MKKFPPFQNKRKSFWKRFVFEYLKHETHFATCYFLCSQQFFKSLYGRWESIQKCYGQLSSFGFHCTSEQLFLCQKKLPLFKPKTFSLTTRTLFQYNFSDNVLIVRHALKRAFNMQHQKVYVTRLSS